MSNPMTQNYSIRRGSVSYVFSIKCNGVYVRRCDTGDKARLTKVKARAMWDALLKNGFKG